MKKFFATNKINFLFLLISFICLINVVGIENISFQSIKWLHDGDESAYNQLGWHFFKNDYWRFPLGNNPNYGDYFGSSIVYTDSIPILALFFKLFKLFLPENFQYFSIWYLICFYLQLFFSFKILKKYTGSNTHSIIGSLFFLIAPIFVFRLNFHVGLSGQWLLLFTLYLVLVKKINESKFLWITLTVLSALIHFYFTVIILVVYSAQKFYNFLFEKKYFFSVAKDIFIIFSISIISLYIVGYFEIRMADSLGLGFGDYKLNILSIFDGANTYHDISWSWFLPDLKLSPGEEMEGFNYFGLGQIGMIIFALFIYFIKNNKKNFLDIKQSKEIKFLIIISVLFTFWSLSNKIALGSYTLLEIPLNKYIFGALSLIKATGRVFWIVNYFLLILSILIIYKSFNKRNSLLLIFLFLTVQAIDVSAGIKNSINKRIYKSDKSTVLNDKIWDDLFKKYKDLRTTYPISWSGFFGDFSYAIEKYNMKKTDLVILVRTNRKKISEARYDLYKNFKEKNLNINSVYIINGKNHLRHLKHIFKNEDVGFYYRDNFWLMVANEKEKMSSGDKELFQKIKPKLLTINETKNLFFEENNSYYGLGWSHNFRKVGIWSEGKHSSLLFSIDKNYGNLKLEISCMPYINKKNKILEFDIYVNDAFNKKVKLEPNIEANKDQKIEILINKDLIKGNGEVKIDFDFKNLTSPYEALESPDSRKLGILAKSIGLYPI